MHVPKKFHTRTHPHSHTHTQRERCSTVCLFVVWGVVLMRSDVRAWAVRMEMVDGFVSFRVCFMNEDLDCIYFHAKFLLFRK